MSTKKNGKVKIIAAPEAAEVTETTVVAEPETKEERVRQGPSLVKLTVNSEVKTMRAADFLKDFVKKSKDVTEGHSVVYWLRKTEAGKKALKKFNAELIANPNQK